MNTHTLLFLACLAVGATTRTEDAAKADREKMQGTWTVVVAEQDTEQKGREELRKVRVAIAGDRLTIRDNSREVPMTEKMRFRLGPAKSPKWIDLTNAGETDKGQTSKGIYLLKGAQLKICFGELGKDRPKTFATRRDSGLTLLVLRRGKP